MMNRAWCVVSLTILLVLGVSLPSGNSQKNEIVPSSVAGWHAAGKTTIYTPRTVFDYLDGGAEVYLAYGMKSVRALRYTRSGEPSIDVSIFEMKEPDGAFGAFTYERVDAEADIGQGSEYGGGILRFWQGSHFVFIQAELETPHSRKAVLTLGTVLAPRLGGDAGLPALLGALPQQGLRPLTVRYVNSPLLLRNLERTLSENSLGLPAHIAAVMARYENPGDPARVLIIGFPGEDAARKGVESYLKDHGAPVDKPAEPFSGKNGWNLVAASGIYAVLILDAPNADGALRRFKETAFKLKEISR